MSEITTGHCVSSEIRHTPPAGRPQTARDEPEYDQDRGEPARRAGPPGPRRTEEGRFASVPAQYVLGPGEPERAVWRRVIVAVLPDN